MSGIAMTVRIVLHASLTAFWLGGALVLAGCGQKGPLFLPGEESAEVPPPATQPTTEPASEDATKKKEEPR
jgi:predicted small lipoprotein YifL